MADYRFSAAIVCRSEGQSAVAAAAYRSGETLHDERTGEIKDYARRSWSVLYTQILTPENAPQWMRDRQRLWNGVERREDRSTKRGTAQLARNIELSLPHELTHEQHVQLVCEFVKDEFVDRGMVADIAIHAPPYRGDGTNHHAHVLLTMRDIDDGGFGNKNRAWNKEELLEHWRERWADYQNRALEKYGHEDRVDHRSLKDQGLDREPTTHLGPNAQALEDQGIRTDRGDQNRRIKSNNDNLNLAKKDLADSEKRLAALRRRFAAEQMEQIQKTVSAADTLWKKGLDQPDTPSPPDRPPEQKPPEPEPSAPAKQPERRAPTSPRRLTAAERIQQIQKALHATDTAWRKHEQPQAPSPEPEAPAATKQPEPSTPTPEHPPEPEPPPAPPTPQVPSGPATRRRSPSTYDLIDKQNYAARAKEEEEKQKADRGREKEKEKEKDPERERDPDRER
jgi:hypothetical protein